MDEIKDLIAKCQIEGIISEEKITNLVAIVSILSERVELLETELADLKATIGK